MFVYVSSYFSLCCFLDKEKADQKKKEEEEEDLSEEDKQLKDELELCVTRLGQFII